MINYEDFQNLINSMYEGVLFIDNRNNRLFVVVFVLTLLAVTGMTHKDSYIDIMMTSLILPVVSSIPAILLGSLGIY